MSETFNQEQYEQSNPIPDKFLKSNGTVETADGTEVEQLSDYGIMGLKLIINQIQFLINFFNLTEV